MSRFPSPMQSLIPATIEHKIDNLTNFVGGEIRFVPE
jgi:hypothetical protein